jgi:hypothetical protein
VESKRSPKWTPAPPSFRDHTRRLLRFLVPLSSLQNPTFCWLRFKSNRGRASSPQAAPRASDRNGRPGVQGLPTLSTSLLATIYEDRWLPRGHLDGLVEWHLGAAEPVSRHDEQNQENLKLRVKDIARCGVGASRDQPPCRGAGCPFQCMSIPTAFW